MTTKPKGVMIVGMDMPKCCRECRFRTCFWYADLCRAKSFEERNGVVLIENLDERPSWCPLQEVNNASTN